MIFTDCKGIPKCLEFIRLQKRKVRKHNLQILDFSPWNSPKVESCTNPEECIEEYHKRQEIISMVKGKTFPFSMNEIIDEINAQETLNQISDEVKDTLDGQGAQDNSEILDEGY